MRNNEWLNGTSHALCMAFAGSNSDVSPSDHIPIMAQTHEDSVCKGNCVKKMPLRKMVNIAQRAQANTNGYFGGYIGKAQPAGHMEIKKCIDKMYTLRDSLARENKALLQKTEPLATAWRLFWKLTASFEVLLNSSTLHPTSSAMTCCSQSAFAPLPRDPSTRKHSTTG